jgi:Glycosyltransferase family 87
MVHGPGQDAARPPGRGWLGRQPGRRLFAAGLVVFAAVAASYLAYRLSHPLNWTLDPVDLRVYRAGGLITRHLPPPYDPRLAHPLYQWPGLAGLHLKFTYTPFAAALFAVVSFIPWRDLPNVSVAVNVAALLATVWFSFGALGWRRSPARAGLTLLTTAAVLWTEPVLRTIFLGQVNLVLMALIIWDLGQPDTRASRWWKGFGVGVAAGIKLVPLIFIPYLLLTRRFRQAAMAVAGFVATVAIGFAVLPGDSGQWWLHGLFFQGDRTGFVGWEGNQSLRGLLTRLLGSVAGSQPAWLIAAVAATAVGLACAVALDRAGHQFAGLLAAALTGLLVSPISWDHHWVWLVPGVALLVSYGVRAGRGRGWPQRARAAWGCWAGAAGLVLLYGAWPGSLWGEPADLGTFSLGVIWQPPNTDPEVYYRRGGDRPWYIEYHWHGIQLITGNAYLLGGLAALAACVVAALLVRPRSAGPGERDVVPGNLQAPAAAPSP